MIITSYLSDQSVWSKLANLFIFGTDSSWRFYTEQRTYKTEGRGSNVFNRSQCTKWHSSNGAKYKTVIFHLADCNKVICVLLCLTMVSWWKLHISGVFVHFIICIAQGFIFSAVIVFHCPLNAGYCQFSCRNKAVALRVLHMKRLYSEPSEMFVVGWIHTLIDINTCHAEWTTVVQTSYWMRSTAENIDASIWSTNAGRNT